MQPDSIQKSLALELSQVLARREDSEFAAAEIAPELQDLPSWRDYFGAVNTSRAQAAIIGRYLVGLGALPARRDRSRGSLYKREEVLKFLAHPPETPVSLPENLGRILGINPAAPRGSSSSVPRAGEENPPRRMDAPSAAMAAVAGASPAAIPPPAAPVSPWSPPKPPNATGPYPAWPQPWWGMPGMPPPTGQNFPGYPPFNPAVTEDAEPDEAKAELPFAFYWSQIRRHWIKIIALAIIVTIFAGLRVRRIPKLYSSTATVRVSASMAGMGMGGNGYASDMMDSLSTLMATIMSDVVTRSVMVDAIQYGKLDRDSYLNPGPARAIPVRELDNELAGEIAGSISVSREGTTRNILVSSTLGNPVTAANVANAVCHGLIEHEFNTRLRALQKSSQWMKQQLANLRAKVEQSQQALVVYQKKIAVLNPEDRESLMNLRMTQLNRDLGVAQSDRIRYQADAHAIASQHLSDLLATSLGPSLEPAIAAVQKAQTHFDEIKAHDGQANPVYVQAARRLQVANMQLSRLRHQASSQIAALYAKASEQERLLRQALQQAQGKQASFNAKAVDYKLLQQEAKDNAELYNDLQRRFDDANLSASFRGQMLRVVNPASPNYGPVYPNVKSSVMLAFLMALLGGCALAILAGYMDRTLKSPEEVERLGVRFLGSLPETDKASELEELLHPAAESEGGQPLHSPYAESVLSLRTAVMLTPGGAEARTFSCTSAEPSEGKSTVSTNLAVAMALHGIKTLLLDAELRRPQAHRHLNVPLRPGLTDVLRGSTPLADCIHPTSQNGLYVMPAGSRSSVTPSQLLSSGLPGLLEQLKQQFQVIFVDCPPLLGFSESLTVASLMDAEIVVARAGKTSREKVRLVLRQLRRSRAHVLGMVLNQVQQRMSPYYSHYENTYYAYSTGEGE